jgi:hypothetical protein
MHKISTLLLFTLLSAFAFCPIDTIQPRPYFISFTVNRRQFNIEAKGKAKGMLDFTGCHFLSVIGITTDSIRFTKPFADLIIDLTCGKGSDYSNEQILALTKDTLHIPKEYFDHSGGPEFYTHHKPWPRVMYITDGEMSSFSKGWLKFSKITRVTGSLYECEGTFDFTYKTDVRDIREVKNGKFRQRMFYQ